MDDMKRLGAAIALNDALEGLANIRIGVLLALARPDLGRFLAELTAPTVPSDASKELSENAIRLVASSDNFLQMLIELLENLQQQLEEEEG
ncbi:hypothetical protein LCGC14_2408740 [marine sediment metagenome]|uniref:Uncharacterized protein n=1 Tax=marine sediment metagenome TaxID=412755 RepID=A0A0F9E5B0_9ZZZZ